MKHNKDQKMASSNVCFSPCHIAIIMDGNGRWANARGLPRIMGHREGAKAVRRAIKAAGEQGVKYLTLYSFSSENWNRPVEEVEELMNLLRRYLKSELAELHEQNIRLRVIGNRSRLQEDIVQLIEQAEELTADNNSLTLVIALSYGSRDEIVRAARKLARAVKKGEMKAEAVTEEAFVNALYTADIPDPDLLIRTSGEHRISNFLLWQLAYAELYFIDKYWPDFVEEDMTRAIKDFNKRDRRYGGVKALA